MQVLATLDVNDDGQLGATRAVRVTGTRQAIQLRRPAHLRAAPDVVRASALTERGVRSKTVSILIAE